MFAPESRPPITHPGPARGRRIGRVRRAVLGLLVVGVLAGCSAGVNQDLAATATPYAIRSPVVAASPVGRLTGARVDLATASAALAAGDVAAAEDRYATAIAGAPSDAAARTGRAAVRVASGDLLGALEDLDAAVAARPGQADLLVRRAEVLTGLGRYADAAKDLDAALAADPAAVEVYLARARLELATAGRQPGGFQAALDALARAAAMAPGSAEVELGRAAAYVERAVLGGDPADWDRALAELDALAEGAGRPVAVALRARALAGRGDLEDARSALDAVSAGRLVPAERALLDAARAEVAIAGEDWDGAVRAAAAAIAADGYRWDAHRALSAAELGRGRAAEAQAAADVLLGRLPDDGRGLYLRGAALAALGREAEARAAFEAAQRALAGSAVYAARIAGAVEGLNSSGDRSGAGLGRGPGVGDRRPANGR
jgi:tetratricopeptide (TPR) repeat protein